MATNYEDKILDYLSHIENVARWCSYSEIKEAVCPNVDENTYRNNIQGLHSEYLVEADLIARKGSWDGIVRLSTKGIEHLKLKREVV